MVFLLILLISCTASMINKLKYVEEYLVDQVDLDGLTPLIKASIIGNLEEVVRQLSLNADPNYQDKEGKTALIHAVINNHVDIVKELLLSRANPNHRDKLGNAALIYAVTLNRIEIVNIFIEVQ